MKKRTLILAILGLILVVGIARIALALHNYHALDDEVVVMEMSTQLLKGAGYSLEWIWFTALAHDGWPQPDPQIMPLLPTLVAAMWLITGQSVPTANAVVASLAAICVLITFVTGWRFFGLGAGVLAAILVVINAYYLHVSITCLTSAVYGLFLTLAIWAFLEATPARLHAAADNQHVGSTLLVWAGLGLASGVAWLTRPEGLLILPALGLTTGYLWWRRRDTGGGARRLVVGFLLAAVLFVIVASPIIIYNLTHYDTPLHASRQVNQWADHDDARFSVTAPTAAEYWATHTLGDFAARKIENLTWMLSLLAEYVTWPVLLFLLIATVWVVWRASPLTAVVVYTLVYLTASLFQSQMSIWPGSQYFMYYSGLLPLWAVLAAGGAMATGQTIRQALSRRWPAWKRAWSPLIIAGGAALLGVTLLIEVPRITQLVAWVGTTATAMPEPCVADYRWMAEHLAPEAIVMTLDTHTLHWYSNHRRAIEIPADDARIIQGFMRRFTVTHLLYKDWLVIRRPVFQPLQQALRTQAELGPYSVLRPVYVGDGILFQVDFAGPPAVLLVNPAGETEERIAQTWLRYAVTDTMPAELSAYPAVIIGDSPPGLTGHFQPVSARFGEGIELLGYQIVKSHSPQPTAQSSSPTAQSPSPTAQSSSPTAQSPSPTAHIQVMLYWRCLAPMEKDYTVFNHLLDLNHVWVAQQDGPPANGLYPTSWWRPGEVIVDRHTIILPGSVPPGDYQLAVGLYDFATMQRLPASGGGDAVILAPVVVGRQP